MLSNFLFGYVASDLGAIRGQGALPFLVSNVCDSDNELYRVRCPLICFYTVEYHLPHRVACQFGARQLWTPSPVSTGVGLRK
jgi:hypothetical protein